MVQDYSSVYMEKEARDILLEMANKIETSKSSKVNESVVNEAAGGLTNLNEVEELIKGMEFNYKDLGNYNTNKMTYSSGYYRDFDISIYFINSDRVKIDDDDDNCFTFTFAHKKDSLEDVTVFGPNSLEKVSLEDFRHLPKNGDYEKQVKALSEVSSQCDSDRIYSIYLDKVKDILRVNFDAVYQMFDSDNLLKERSYKGTLAVGYSRRYGKFVFYYNPDFIIMAAVEEYVAFPEKYKSLASCYIYMLAYSISHEMMHILTNNVSSGDTREGAEFGAIDVNSGSTNTVSNVVEDSFINSELARNFAGLSGVETSDSLSPFPHGLINDSIDLRSEFGGPGFKYYKKSGDLIAEIANVFQDATRQKIETLNIQSVGTVDTSYLAGADFFVSVKVDPKADEIRRSSIVFQKFVNDVVKAITDGKIAYIGQGITDEEYLNNLEKLEEGDLVKINDGTNNIYTVTGRIAGEDDKEKNAKYSLDKTSKGVIRRAENGAIICTYGYTSTGESAGTVDRPYLIKFNPDSVTWAEDDPNHPYQKPDDGPDDGPEPPIPPGGGDGPEMPPTPIRPEDQKTKKGGEGGKGGKDNTITIIRPGDIVWLPNKQKYGKIISMNNGEFEIEEVKIEQFSRVKSD